MSGVGIFTITSYSYLVTVINDGSTDRTEEILSLYSKNVCGKAKSWELEIITQENRGFSGARNRGLSMTYGKYIMFLDSDDILLPDAIESMMNAAKETEADILQGGWCIFGGDIREELRPKEEGLLLDNCGIFSGYPWGKLYKYNVLEHFIFPEGFWFEDTPISFILMAMPYRFAAIKNLVYGYRSNPQGITQMSYKQSKSIDSYYITERCLEEFPEFGLDYDQRAYEYYLRQVVMNWRRTRLQPKEVREAIFVLTVELMERYFKGFCTEVPKMKRLESAIKDRTFLMYEALIWAM